MKNILLGLMIVVSFISCQKEFSCIECDNQKVDTVLVGYIIQYKLNDLYVSIILDKELPDTITVTVTLILNTITYISDIVVPQHTLVVAAGQGLSDKGWEAKITSITPNKGTNWIVKY